jgi:NADH-quinone oxidoreductase subunit K
MIVPYGHVLILAVMSFAVGLVCMLARRNLIMLLVGVEIMMNGAAIAFVGAALRWQLLTGQVFVLFLIGVAGAEVSVGLVLIVAAYRKTESLDPDTYNLLKW